MAAAGRVKTLPPPRRGVGARPNAREDGCGMALLDVADLQVSFPTAGGVVRVVDGVSFSLDAGQTLGLIGESGSGKSLTAHAIIRMVPPPGRVERGSVVLAVGDRRVDLAALDPYGSEIRRLRGGEVAMVFQDPASSLSPVHTVGSQLAETVRTHRPMSPRAARQTAAVLLDQVGLADPAGRLHDHPHQLSGGMRQRVMIAMALACNPRILIADEPTTALDVTVQAQIMALLSQLREETGMSMIFISHDIGLVAGVADRIMVMHEGLVAEQNDVDALLDAPRHAYTRHLLKAVPHFRSGRAARSTRADESSRTPILRVKDLVVRFRIGSGLFGSRGAVHAVEGVSFDLGAGETLAIVGESGSGKSTTARAILGLDAKVAGTISVDHKNSHRPVQMVFQDPFGSLNPRLNVESLLAEPVIAAGGKKDQSFRDRARAILDNVGLPANIFARFPHQFSGGQRQRLCIARALMLNPDVVVLDEAVSALDVSVQSQVLDLLVDLQNRLGLAYLFISHDMAVVERIAHRVAVMYEGQIVEIGAAKSVLATPHHAYTKRLIAAVPAIESRHQRFSMNATRVPSLIRAPGYQPPPSHWRSVGADHLVRIEATT